MNPGKILVIQLRRLGDVLLATPALRVLKEAYPSAQIDFLTEPPFAPILEGNPHIRTIKVFSKNNMIQLLRDVRRERYDWVLDFMNNPRSAQLTFWSGAAVRAGFDVPFWKCVYNRRIRRPPVPTYAVESKLDLLRSLGVSAPEGRLPELFLSDPDVSLAKDWCRQAGLDRFRDVIGIAPTSRRPLRRWPLKHYRSFMEQLQKNAELRGAEGRAFILFWGGEEEKKYIQDLAGNSVRNCFIIPPMTIKEMAAVLSRCRLVVTNDNGPEHLSVAVGTPILSLHGPTWARSWNPGRLPHRYIQIESLGCVGCNRAECPYGHECMQWLRPERVAEAAEEMLAC